MEKYLLVLMFMSSVASANCGSLPVRSSLLEQPELTADQIQELQSHMEVYLEEIDKYVLCTGKQSNALDSESEDYESLFFEYMRLIEVAQESKLLTINRFNDYIDSNAE